MSRQGILRRFDEDNVSEAVVTRLVELGRQARDLGLVCTVQVVHGPWCLAMGCGCGPDAVRYTFSHPSGVPVGADVGDA